MVHCVNFSGDFALSCCDFDLNPITFVYELNLYPLEISPQTKNELRTSRLSKVIVLHTYRHNTDRHTPAKLLPHRFEAVIIDI